MFFPKHHQHWLSSMSKKHLARVLSWMKEPELSWETIYTSSESGFTEWKLYKEGQSNMLCNCPKSPHLIPTVSNKLKEKIEHLLSLLRTSLCNSHCSYFKNETKSGCEWKDPISSLFNYKTPDLQGHLVFFSSSVNLIWTFTSNTDT